MALGKQEGRVDFKTERFVSYDRHSEGLPTLISVRVLCIVPACCGILDVGESKLCALRIGEGPVQELSGDAGAV